jgi:hypothetical protein
VSFLGTWFGLIKKELIQVVPVQPGNVGGAAEHPGRGTNFLMNNEAMVTPEGLQLVPLNLARHLMSTPYYRDSKCPQRWTKLFGPTRMDAIHKGVVDVCADVVEAFLFSEGTPSWLEVSFTRGLEDFLRDNVERFLAKRNHLPPLKLSRVRVAQRTPAGVTGLNDLGIMTTNELGVYFNLKAPLWPSASAHAFSWLCYLVLYLTGDWRKEAAEQYSYAFLHMAPLDAPPLAQLRFRADLPLLTFLRTLPGVPPLQTSFTFNEVPRCFENVDRSKQQCVCRFFGSFQTTS